MILESSEMTIQVSSVKVTKELQTGQTVSALCGYTAAKDDELTLEAGQTLRILSVGQDGWTEAFTGSSVGWIPGSVTLEPISLDEEESPLPSVDLLDHYRLQTLFKNADSLDPLHAATSSASSYCSTSLTTAPSLLPRDEKLELRATLTTAFIEEETRFMDELEAVLDTQSASELCSMWLPLKIHKALIESLQDLLNFHQVLTQSLRLVAQAEPQDQLTGGYILDFIPFFSEVYSEYKAQLPKMMTHAIESSSDFSKKSFGSLYRRSSTGLNSVVTPVLQFTASMSRPAQRMFKLVQFLRRLLEVTPLDHEDRELSLVAWRASRDAIVAIDSQVKTIENHETVHQLVKQVDNWDVRN